MATLAMFRTRIRNAYAETDTTFTTDTEIDLWVNDALAELARDTHYHKITRYADFVADQPNYDVSSLNILEIERIMIASGASASTYQYVQPIPWHVYERWTRSGVDADDSPNVTGTPTHYSWHGKYLWFYPCPSYSTTGDLTSSCYGIRLDAAAMETLSDDTDSSELPVQFESLVVYFGLARWYEKDNNPSLANYYRQLFELGKRKLSGWLSTMRTIEPERLSIAVQERSIRRA